MSHPENDRIAARQRRIARRKRLRIAKKRGNHNKYQWLYLKWWTGGRCPGCGRILDSREYFTRDHITPPQLGGSNSILNIQPLCAPCNVKKAATRIDYRDAQLRMAQLRAAELSAGELHKLLSLFGCLG